MLARPHIVLVFVLSICNGLGVVDIAVAEPAKRLSLTTDQVRDLIQKLDADSFSVREAATSRLSQAEYGAIALLGEAVAESNLEVTTRLIRILGEMATSDDVEVERAARAELEKIADARVTSAATRAAETLATLVEIREDRCLDQLKRLGAVVEKHTYGFSNGVVDLSYSLDIDRRWKGTDADIALLRGVPHVRHLTIDNPRFNDAWITSISQLTGLTDLVIARGRVSAKGIASLRELGKLETVRLMYIPLGDDSIETLAAMKSVRSMRLYGTNLTKDGIKSLGEALPNCALDVRRGAFLGIEAAQGLPQCVIGDVRAGSAADRAGLMADDVILKYNEHNVANFEGLTALIAENAPGDKVSVTVLRGEDRLVLPVTLGEWDLSIE